MPPKTYEVILSNGAQPQIDSYDKLSDIIKSLEDGWWFRDKDGWNINPAYIISIRLMEKSTT